MALDQPEGAEASLLNTIPTWQQRRLVAAAAGALLIGFGAIAPFAGMAVQRFDAFVPLMAAAISITNLITSILLFAHFSIYRSTALLVLASGYLFTALVVTANSLTIPGAFSPTGLLGAGLQTAGWLYCVWHTAIPAVLLIYTWLKESKRSVKVSARFPIGWAVATTFLLACGFTLFAIQGEDFLPRLLLDRTHATPLTRYVVFCILLFCAIALAVMWVRRRSVLDYWLMIVALSLMAELAFTLIGAGRASVGAYANRIFSLVTSTIILVLLLAEMTRLYANLARTNAMLQRERDNKLMNLEAMTASIAHEVRQPLGTIATSGSAALQFLGRAPPDLEEVRSALNMVVSESHRASQVFDNIRALFGRADKGQTLDINEIIHEVLRTLRGELKDRGITTRTELRSDLPLVVGHRGQLQEVLLNLVRNAIESMDSVKDGRRVLQVRTEHHGRDKVVVAVEDTGPGIDPKKLDGIFDAFISTKPQGMGLGLAICRTIIERHGGQLSASSDGQNGALFQFVLPTQAVDKNAARAE